MSGFDLVGPAYDQATVEQIRAFGEQIRAFGEQMTRYITGEEPVSGSSGLNPNDYQEVTVTR